MPANPDLMQTVNSIPTSASGDGFIVAPLSGTANVVIPAITILSSGFVTYNKESVNVSANSRITNQEVKLFNWDNEYWGQFRGVFSGLVSGITDVKIEWGNLSGNIQAQYDLINLINESVTGLSAHIPVPNADTISSYIISGTNFFDAIALKSLDGDIFYVETFYNRIQEAINEANAYSRSLSAAIISSVGDSISAGIDAHNADITAHGYILSALSGHILDVDNPHLVTKDQVGLGNVENISISQTVNDVVSSHNASVSAHYDNIVTLIDEKTGNTPEIYFTYVDNNDGTCEITGLNPDVVNVSSIYDIYVPDYIGKLRVETVGGLCSGGIYKIKSLHGNFQYLKSTTFNFDCSDDGLFSGTYLETVDLPKCLDIDNVFYNPDHTCPKALSRLYLPSLTGPFDIDVFRNSNLASVELLSSPKILDSYYLSFGSVKKIYLGTTVPLTENIATPADIVFYYPHGSNAWVNTPTLADCVCLPYDPTFEQYQYIGDLSNLQDQLDAIPALSADIYTLSGNAYSASNPPPYPVTSVNTLTGHVVLNAHTVSATTSADVQNIASGLIQSHNIGLSAHQDIRDSISSYDWYVDTTTTPNKLKRIKDETYYFYVETISAEDKTLKIIGNTGPIIADNIFPKEINIISGSIKNGWRITKIESIINYYSYPEILAIEDVEEVSSYGCSVLTCKKIILPNCKSLGIGAFYQSEQLSDIYIPKVTLIPDRTFSRTTALSTINLDGVESLGQYAFGDEYIANTTLTNIYAPKVKTISDNCFLLCSSLSNVYCPLVETVGVQAFAVCTALTSISLPVCKSLGNYAFAESGVTDIYIPLIETIGEEAFTYNNIPTKTINVTVINLSVVSNLNQWDSYSTLSSPKLKVPYEYLSVWKAEYPSLVIDNVSNPWTIVPYADNDISIRIKAHDSATDSHSDIRNELDNCLSTVAVSGFNSSKQYAFVVNADGTIKNGSLQEIIIPDVSLDNSSVTENLSGNIQAVGVIDGSGILITGSEIRESINSATNAVFKNDTRHVSIGTDLFSLYNLSPVYRIPMPDYGFGYTISKIVVRCYSTPITQLDANIMYCDTWTTGSFPSTNPTLVRAINTTSGNYDSGTISINITSGKELYLLMDANVDYGTMWDITLTYQMGVN